MKILNNKQNSEEWFEDRLGKITGSKLRNIIVKRGNKRKMGFYELIAERLSIPDDYDNAMERGHSLEEGAIKMFEKQEGEDVEHVGLCVSDTDEHITLSPDGLIKKDGKYKEAVEVKCLSSANHLRAYIEQKPPSEYEEQFIQYFIVNEDLEKLNIVFYDPRVNCLPYHRLLIFRSDIEDKIKEYREYQEKTLDEIEEIITNLTF